MRTRDMLVAVSVGAIAAYVADPRGGPRRRALIRDRFVRAGRRTRDAVDATTRDVANRTSGIVAATRARVTSGPADDHRLHLAQPSLDVLHRDWAPATPALVTAAGLAAAGLCMAAYARR